MIDSDLDDSDDEVRNEGEDGEDEGEVDIVFCVYEKVSLGCLDLLWVTSRMRSSIFAIADPSSSNIRCRG